MIAGLIGNIVSREVNCILLNVSGVIYEVFMSLNSISRAKSDEMILITQIIREDSIALYGFLDKDEKNMFDNLIKINGIGPKVAMAICGAFKPAEIIENIKNNNIASLKKVPGVGEKMAKRIIVEMSGKMENFVISSDLSNPKQAAMLGLESLGFKASDIYGLVNKSDKSDVEGIIKDVLRQIKK